MEKVELLIEKLSKNNKINYDEIINYNLTNEEFNELLKIAEINNIEIVVSNEVVSETSECNDVSEDGMKQYISEIIRYRVLTDKELEMLFMQYKNGSEEAKRKIIESNLRLVVSRAKKYYEKSTNSTVSLLDLIQDGNRGLIKAVEDYDISLGYKFSTYAVFKIDQTIQRGVVDTYRNIRVPVHVFDQIVKLKKFESDYIQKNKNMPTIKEYSEAFKLNEEEVRYLLLTSMELVSLQKYVGDKEDIFLEDLIVDDTTEFPEIEDKIYIEFIMSEIEKILNVREFTVLKLRMGFYGKAYTLGEIGNMLEMTGERIRQIEKKALIKLRTALKPELAKNWFK